MLNVALNNAIHTIARVANHTAFQNNANMQLKTRNISEENRDISEDIICKFNIILNKVENSISNKIKIIGIFHEQFGISLKDAKKYVDNTPSSFDVYMSYEKVEAIKNALITNGADIIITLTK